MGKPEATLRISIADLTALRVRVKDPNSPPPDLLYQWLPESCMSLLASLPDGTAAVSIPQQNGRHPISRSFPEVSGGIIIVYARKPNGRYEADEVLLGGESFRVGQFCDIARDWVETKMGGLQLVPDTYAYFAPTRDEWGVILRDGGFAVFDPSSMELEITAKTLSQRLSPWTSGVIARIQLHACGSADQGHVPVFSRIGLTTDASPTPAIFWTGFVEWQRLRSIKSRPPDRIVPQIRQWLRTLTRESGFQSWHFRKGMYFGDHMEWWGDQNRRRTLHEGIDFAEGLLPGNGTGPIPEKTPVRSISSGNVIAVLDDFLNKTLLVQHPEITDGDGNIFHTLISHIHPLVCAGPVERDQVIGRVIKSRNAGAPSHLHLTGAWIPGSIPAGEITMDMISSAFAPIVLVNFNSLLTTA